MLRILDLACDNAKTAEHMNNADGTKRLFNFMENTENEKLKFEALKVVVCLAESLNGKKVFIYIIIYFYLNYNKVTFIH